MGLSMTQITAPLHHHQAKQAPHDVPVDLDELSSGTAGANVVAGAKNYFDALSFHLYLYTTSSPRAAQFRLRRLIS
jgi:hypothetical protein